MGSKAVPEADEGLDSAAQEPGAPQHQCANGEERYTPKDKWTECAVRFVCRPEIAVPIEALAFQPEIKLNREKICQRAKKQRSSNNENPPNADKPIRHVQPCKLISDASRWIGPCDRFWPYSAAQPTDEMGLWQTSAVRCSAKASCLTYRQILLKMPAR